MSNDSSVTVLSHNIHHIQQTGLSQRMDRSPTSHSDKNQVRAAYNHAQYVEQQKDDAGISGSVAWVGTSTI